MKFLLKICLLLSFLSSGFIWAQQSWYEGVIFDSSGYKLEEAIKDASLKQAIYSYNVANASTPGFKPVLLEEDRQELLRILPEDSPHFDKVAMEFMTAKMQRNSRRHTAYYALYRKKIDNWRQISTLGKK